MISQKLCMETLNFNLIFCLIVQANLIFGLAGMIWPRNSCLYMAF